MTPYRVVITETAYADLDHIADYVAVQSGYPAHAIAYVERLIAHAEALDNFPHRGADRSDILADLRILGYRRQVTITYRVDDDARTVEILRFLRRGLDWTNQTH